MRNRWIRLLGVAVAAYLLLFSLGNAPVTHAEEISPSPADSLQPMEAQLLNLLNDARAGQGLAPLQVDGSLEDIARWRSSDMATYGYFGHVSSDGTMAFDKMNAAGVPYQLAAENLARNHESPDISAQVAHSGFLNSPEHRENELEPAFNKIGIGASVAGDGTVYFTELFATIN